ncbi:hypothetical protein BDD12DRAFT_909765 [Trichophaea hybrida]|nr:hypothetical protein BDD12DRAFT_909765 [Trichophaea hybrida]
MNVQTDQDYIIILKLGVDVDVVKKDLFDAGATIYQEYHWQPSGTTTFAAMIPNDSISQFQNHELIAAIGLNSVVQFNRRIPAGPSLPPALQECDPPPQPYPKPNYAVVLKLDVDKDTVKKDLTEAGVFITWESQIFDGGIYTETAKSKTVFSAHIPDNAVSFAMNHESIEAFYQGKTIIKWDSPARLNGTPLHENLA